MTEEPNQQRKNNKWDHERDDYAETLFYLRTQVKLWQPPLHPSRLSVVRQDCGYGPANQDHNPTLADLGVDRQRKTIIKLNFNTIRPPTRIVG